MITVLSFVAVLFAIASATLLALAFAIKNDNNNEMNIELKSQSELLAFYREQNKILREQATLATKTINEQRALINELQNKNFKLETAIENHK